MKVLLQKKNLIKRKKNYLDYKKANIRFFIFKLLCAIILIRKAGEKHEN